jgi:protein TonB
MNAHALHAPPDHAAAIRWTGSALVIVAVHLALILAGVAWYTQPEQPGVAVPAIMVDMAPAPAALQVSTLDAAPGPEMQQADAPTLPPPEAVQQQQPVEEQIAPTPLMEKPVVEAPPEQKTPSPPTPPEPARIVPEPAKPVPVKPKPVRVEKKRPSEQPPAPRTTAAPKADRQARSAAGAPSGAAAAAALPEYRSLLAAHLQRYKQYPGASKAAGEQGTATLTFTVGRGGQVLSSRLGGSSGYPALDAETLALIRRAQPLPAFPPEMTQASMSFSVPIHYSIR